jgi:hypothetical protein
MLGKSCLTNLLETLDVLTMAMEDKYDVIMILLDFAKAFDKVSHARLLAKLRQYGFGAATCEWVKAFLTNRKQRVVIGQAESEWRDVSSGVPQGSVLGTFLLVWYT